LQSLSGKALCYHFSQSLRRHPLLLLAQPSPRVVRRDFVAGVPIVTILVLGECSLPHADLNSTCHDDRHERTGRSDACRMRRFELCRLHPDDRSLGMTGAPSQDGNPYSPWNVAMGVLVYRRLHLMPGLVTSFKSYTGKKKSARRPWD